MMRSILVRCFFTAGIVSLLGGCEMTMPTLQFSNNSNMAQSNEGQVIDNPYPQESMHDKPNKSEIEVAAYGSPQASPDYAGAGSSDMEQGMYPSHEHPYQDTAMVREYVPVMPVPRSSYRPAYTHKALSDYAEQMAMNMLQKTKHITPNSRIAVASFVDFSQDLQSTSVLGNRLAESFMTELQGYGLAIVDFKAMPAIKVTSNGDLFFERSGPRGDMQFVLTGTLHRNERGVEVNARIVNIYDQVVVATTKGFIPHFVVSSLTPDYVLMGSR